MSTLRDFVARIIGWSKEHASEVDQAVRSIELATERRAHLVLCGQGDLVPIAQALHRRCVGEGPFIVCDPRRGNTRETVRAPKNQENVNDALNAAIGGSLCVRRHRLPHDFELLADQLRYSANASRVLYIICYGHDDVHPLLVRPAPIKLTPLDQRENDIPRIVNEYARDAIEALGARATHFINKDHNWVVENSASSISEIEKGTLRLVAKNMSKSTSAAAARLNMAPVSLFRWLARRGLNIGYID